MQPALAWFDRIVVPLFGGIAAIILFCMMCLTCADVIGRYFLNNPIFGAFELTEMMMAGLIFLGLPLVTLGQDHVTVDVLDPVTPDGVLRFQHMIASLIACVATAYLAWRLSIRGGNLMNAGETTAQLKLPLGYLAHGMSVLMAVTALCFLVLVFRRPRRQTTGEV